MNLYPYIKTRKIRMYFNRNPRIKDLIEFSIFVFTMLITISLIYMIGGD